MRSSTASLAGEGRPTSRWARLLYFSDIPHSRVKDCNKPMIPAAAISLNATPAAPVLGAIRVSP